MYNEEEISFEDEDHIISFPYDEYNDIHHENINIDEPHTKLLVGHGILNLDGNELQSFEVPKDTYIITLTKSGVKLYDKFLYQIYRFYREGNFIFDKQDKSRKLSKKGIKLYHALMGHLNKIKGYKTMIKKEYTQNLFFKNHMPGDVMNNQVIQVGYGCSDESSRNHSNLCGILFTSKDINIKYNPYIEYEVDDTTLKEIVEIQGPGVYVVLSCRALDTEGEMDYLNLLKQTRMTSGNGYDYELPEIPGKTEYLPRRIPGVSLVDYFKNNNRKKLGITQNNLNRININKQMTYQGDPNVLRNSKKINRYITPYNNRINYFNAFPNISGEKRKIKSNKRKSRKKK